MDGSQKGPGLMTFQRAIRVDGEGMSGLQRMTPMHCDRSISPEIIDIKLDDELRRAFLHKIQEDVKQGTFNPAEIIKRLSASRSKSSETS